MATVHSLQTSNSGLQPKFPRISGFTVLEHLHEGSHSSIYRARQDRLGRIVALKLLPEWPPPTDIALERFNRAAYANAQAPHPNLAALYDTGTRDEFHYVAMEFVTGQTLQRQLAQTPKADEHFAVEVGLRAAQALTALHAKDICHRNIKPKNIFIENNGGVRLIGLGLASCQGAFFSPHLDAHPIGTPHFMAPEMIRGCYTDPRSDLYSLGITLFLMTAGCPPFDIGVPAVVLSRHLVEEPHSLARLRPDLSPQFIAVVNKMIAREPAQRFQSAREVVEACVALSRKQHVPLAPLQALRDVNADRPASPVLAAASRALSHPVVIGFVSALAATSVLLLASYTMSWPWGLKTRGEPERMPATPSAPYVAPENKEPANVSAEVREFNQLLEAEDSRRNDPLAGAEAWAGFLRNHPQASATRYEYAHFKLEQYLKRLKGAASPSQPSEPSQDF